MYQKSGILSVKSAVIALAFLLAGVAAGVSASAAAADTSELRYRPDAGGNILTWLVSEPIAISLEDDFTRDHLAQFGGEEKFRAGGLLLEADGTQMRWNVITADTPVVKPSRRADTAREVRYLATTIVPAESGTYDVNCSFFAEAKVWLNGKELMLGVAWHPDRLTAMRERVELEAGKEYHLLLKLGNHRGIGVTALGITGAGGKAADFELVLPVESSQAALASYLLEAIDIEIHEYRFFEPDRTARINVSMGAGRAQPPGLASQMSAVARIRTRDGKRLGTFQLGRFSPAELAQKPLSFTYRLRSPDVSPFYTVSVEFQHNDASVGQVDERFYCLPGIEDYASEIAKRAEKFYKERPEDELYADENLAFLYLKLEQLALHYDTRGQSYRFGEEALEIVLSAEKRIEMMERRLYLRPSSGFNEFAYVSRVDDSAQPYFIYVPRFYNPMRGAPMLVFLHGYVSHTDKLNWRDILIPQDLIRKADEHGYILLVPFGRSNTDFQGIGEEDVVHVLDLALRKLHVQRDRIFLVGYSMGGMGAFTIGGHYPDRFAGIVSLAGRPDFYLWKNATPEELQPFKNWLIGLEFGMNMPENFRHLPLLAYHNTRDTLIKYKQSEQFVKKLQSLNYDATLVSLTTDDGHWISRRVFSNDDVFEWLKDRRQPDAPKKISYATYSLKYSKAYWATIDDFRKWGERAVIDVEVTGDNEITVNETNVAAFTLSPPEKLIDARRPVVVKVNGEEHKFDETPISIVLEPARPAQYRKTPTLCGPIKDAYNTRFVFVYGTQGNPVENNDLYKQAQKAVSDWRGFVKSAKLFDQDKDPLMVRDRDLTDEQRKSSNLILIGCPKTNSVLAEVEPRLPIRIKDSKTFIVDGKTYTGENIGLNMIYPSPFGAGRYVVIMTGHTYGRGLAENHKLDMLPDYIIYDAASDREIFDLYDGFPNHSRCAGFFDKYWELDKTLMWTQEPAAAEPATPVWR